MGVALAEAEAVPDEDPASVLLPLGGEAGLRVVFVKAAVLDAPVVGDALVVADAAVVAGAVVVAAALGVPDAAPEAGELIVATGLYES